MRTVAALAWTAYPRVEWHPVTREVASCAPWVPLHASHVTLHTHRCAVRLQTGDEVSSLLAQFNLGLTRQRAGDADGALEAYSVFIANSFPMLESSKRNSAITLRQGRALSGRCPIGRSGRHMSTWPLSVSPRAQPLPPKTGAVARYPSTWSKRRRSTAGRRSRSTMTRIVLQPRSVCSAT